MKVQFEDSEIVDGVKAVDNILVLDAPSSAFKPRAKGVSRPFVDTEDALLYLEL